MDIISLLVPDELIEELDSVLGDEPSPTRSEVIRQDARKYILEYNKLNDLQGNAIAAITVFDGKMKKNIELFPLQHEFSDMITASLHSKPERRCLSRSVDGEWFSFAAKKA